jgi:uncharacterized protein (DUF1697 family)
MAVYVALLRAINLAGHNKVGMKALRDMLTALGFVEPTTLLQSGNAVFRGPARSTARLESQLEAEARTCLGLDIDFMLRTSDEWQELIARNPFPTEAKRDPGHLLVLFLKDTIDAKRAAALEAAIVGRERIRAHGKQVYAVYPDGVGRSKLTNAVIEKHLGVRATGRNWNTVLKLKELACG